MLTYKILAVGTFKKAGNCQPNSRVTLSTGESVAGFYTARAVQAPNADQAIAEATEMIANEIESFLNVAQGDYDLEIESCEKLDHDPNFSNEGFTFFSQE